MTELVWRAPPDLAGDRLDKVVTLAGDACERRIPRPLARTLIESGQVTLDGRVARASSQRVRGGEVLRIRLKASAPERPKLPVAILYRDEVTAAIEKPAGLPSEPTLDRRRPNALGLARAALRLEEEDFLGLPHRLDRDTSGVLLLALSEAALATLGRSLEERTASKLYTALVHGRVAEDERRHESFLAKAGKRGDVEVMGSVRSGGKRAVTVVKVLERGAKFSLVECAIETGRTHQIRVHLSEAGHPIAGDELYGAPAGEHARLGRHFLHATRVALPHPVHEGATLAVESPVPSTFRALLES